MFAKIQLYGGCCGEANICSGEEVEMAFYRVIGCGNQISSNTAGSRSGYFFFFLIFRSGSSLKSRIASEDI